MGLFDFLRRAAQPDRRAGGALARGETALSRRQLDQAEDAFRQALAAAGDPDAVAVARNKLAIVAIRRGDRAGAVEELLLALEAAPRSPAPVVTLGNLLLEDGRLDQAIVHYEHAIVLDDAYAPAYHNLGVALHRGGRRREAVRYLKKATKLEARITR